MHQRKEKSVANQITKFQFEPPKAFGTNEEVQAIIERMEALIPVKMDESDRRNTGLMKNLGNAYLKAAQLSVFYRLVPGVDVHLIKFGQDFAVDTGVSSWQKAADRYCALHNITYHAIYEEMPADELRKRRTDKLYTPNDVGYICYIWRSDKQAVYQMFGSGDPEKMKLYLTKGYGHWAEKAKWNQSKQQWTPDEIPAQRTKHDVARRRALKAALKAEFSLDSLLAAAPNETREMLSLLDSDARSAKMQAAPSEYVRPGSQVNADGFPEDQVIDGSWHDDADFDNEDNGHWEDTDEEAEAQGEYEEQPDPFNVSVYRELSDALTGEAKTMMEWSKQYHADSDGKADVVQYRILVGEIDRLIGKGKHSLLFGVLLCREVHSGNPPGEKFVRFLLHFIQKDRPQKDAEGNTVKNEKGRVVKAPNAGYREQFVEAIKETWNQIETLQNADS